MSSEPSTTHRQRRSSRVAGFATFLCLAAVGCGGASTPSPVAIAVAPSPVGAPSRAVAGPTSWAAWIEHQGFGASAGPNEVRRTARWIADNGGAEDLFYLDNDIALVADMIAWLDSHPATACWADYHAEVRRHLVTVLEGWTKARPDVEAGKRVPADIVASGMEAANAASDLPAPAGCP